jgi:hypothetical protein
MKDQSLATALRTVHRLFASSASDSSPFPPTLLYNEGWLLRLILDWFAAYELPDHWLDFARHARWYSEAYLPSAFAARRRRDPLAEASTHADAVIGHFEIGARAKGDLSLRPDATQLVVLEAKLFSRLSVGVKNVATFDQAARSVACIAETLRRARRHPASLKRLGFYVLAPHTELVKFASVMSP